MYAQADIVEGMSKKTTRPTDLAGTIRKAIESSGLLRSELARQSGLSYSMIHRFMDGHDLNLASGSKLCEALGLELVASKRKGA